MAASAIPARRTKTLRINCPTAGAGESSEAADGVGSSPWRTLIEQLRDPLLRSARSAPAPQAPADARDRQRHRGKEDERGEQKPDDYEWIRRRSWHGGCGARVIQEGAVQGLEPVSANDQDRSIGQRRRRVKKAVHRRPRGPQTLR